MLRNTCDFINVELKDGVRMRLFSLLKGGRWRRVPPAFWHVLRLHKPTKATPTGVAECHLFVDPATHSLLVGRRVQANTQENGYVDYVSVDSDASAGGSRN